MRARLATAMLLAALSAGPALAVQPDEILADPALEARARVLSADLRCLVCQNQSIDDSNAPLARDLRLIVRERLKAGDSNAEVKAYLVARYGEFVLLNPPFSAGTLLLWLAPVLLLATGGLLAWRHLRGVPVPAGRRADAPLSPDEARRLADILKQRE